MSETPVIIFRDEAQLKKYAREWQERLFLHNWDIQVKMCNHVYQEDGTEVVGKNSFVFSGNSSYIEICNGLSVDFARDRICFEQVLVHEMLHLIVNFLSAPNTYEGTYFDTIEHGNLDRLAKSLILAKYNLPWDWFSTFDYGSYVKELNENNADNEVETKAERK